MDKVTAFDALFTNNQIQKLKVLISYVDSPMQRQLAIYIKFLELKYTLELFQRSPQLTVSPAPQEGPPDPGRLCQEVSPYCSPGERNQLNQFASMFQAMSHYQEIMEMVKMFQDMFPEGMSFPGAEAAGSEGGEGGADGMAPDPMSAGLGGLFGGGMPDISQLMSMMNMMQPGNSAPAEPPPPDNTP
ncbi:MAG: hypothetical protein HFH80_14585 [Lachnospiraceae bacterium]|nr:hypothetical protein [Lachnospiraceae bacterium]